MRRELVGSIEGDRGIFYGNWPPMEISGTLKGLADHDLKDLVQYGATVSRGRGYGRYMEYEPKLRAVAAIGLNVSLPGSKWIPEGKESANIPASEAQRFIIRKADALGLRYSQYILQEGRWFDERSKKAIREPGFLVTFFQPEQMKASAFTKTIIKLFDAIANEFDQYDIRVDLLRGHKLVRAWIFSDDNAP